MAPKQNVRTTFGLRLSADSLIALPPARSEESVSPFSIETSSRESSAAKNFEVSEED